MTGRWQGFEMKRELKILRHSAYCLRQRLSVFGKVLVLSGLLCFLNNAAVSSAEAGTNLWSALRSGGHLVLLRHASAPGLGDPEDFTLGDCTTQRNLSADGRSQAFKIGELFKANGIQSAKIFSSQWCRCLETAELLDLGPVKELPALNSFFSYFRGKGPQTRKLQEWLRQQSLEQPLVLVTHQVNITALTDVLPSAGELVVVRRDAAGELTLVATLETE